MNSALEHDQAARRIIKEQLQTNLFVEASAGSGKTSSLVARVVALVAGGHSSLDKIAVVTFTRKAAGELRERVQISLEEQARKAEGVEKERLLAAIDDLNLCFIGTIHAFCSAMLRERPIEAGLSPDFAEVEGSEEERLEAQAWTEYLKQLSSEVRVELEQAGVTPEQLYHTYHRLNAYPEVEFPHYPLPRPNLSMVRSRLPELITLARELVPAHEPDKGWDNLQSKLRQLLRWDRIFDWEDDLVLIDLLEKLEGPAAVTQNRWSHKDIAIQARDTFASFQDEVINPALTAWREYRYHFLVQAASPAVAYYQQWRRQKNCLNFQDLLLCTASLLKDNPEVRGYFQRRYQILLVDEFQDTDPLQAEIMMYLCSDNLQQTDWTLIRPRAGSLFVVGDPQQSIYRFRRADIITFYQIKEQIKAAGGMEAALTRNFRSLPTIVEWVNQAFSSLFARGVPPQQVIYRDMCSARDEDPAALMGIQVINLDKETNHNSEKIAAQDARRVAAYINECLVNRVQILMPDGTPKTAEAQDFMILVNVKKHIALYARELGQWGIPYEVSGQNQMENSVPLQEFWYLIQAVNAPDNPIYLTAILRGIFYGFSDHELYDYHKAGGEFCFLNPVPESLSGELVIRFQLAFQQLMHFRKLAEKQPPISALEIIAEELGLLPLLITEAKASIANYYLLIDHLRDETAQRAVGFEQITEMVGQFLRAGAEDELDLNYGQVKGVRLMNLHKAKGLEAPVVILADPSTSLSGDMVDLHVKRSGQASTAWLMIKEQAGDFRRRLLAVPPQWQAYHDAEAGFLEAERIRLLYVAATRAKNALVISHYPDKAAKSPWFDLVPYLNTVKVVSMASDALIPGKGSPDHLPSWEEFESAKLIRRRQFEQGRIYGYQIETVTGAVHQGNSQILRSSRGKGPNWGNAVHRALEVLVHNPSRIKDRDWLGQVLENTRCDPNELPIFQELLNNVMGTELWQRVINASEVLTEVPFGLWDAAVSSYRKGTIDLVFRDDGGWVIADYKSDAVGSGESLQSLTEYYRPQVAAYAKYWKDLTEEDVIESGILFTDIPQWITL